MTLNGLLQIAVYIGLLVLLVKPLGLYMARVFSGERTFLDPLLRPIELVIYRISGVEPRQEQHWTTYTAAMLLFNLAGMVLLYALQRLQRVLPLNPQGFGPPSPDSAFNTAVSFTSNTNWQSYTGESTMSYLSQMAGLTMQNFVSAATGIALAIALIRAFARHSAQTLGNFWVDLVRTTLWVLLPLSLVLALVLVWQGLPQNLQAYVDATTLEGGSQVIAQGPVASQLAIKQLGTNGGGFFNANSTHPYENPTPLSNFLEMLAILVIGAALTYTFGHMVGDTRQGWAIFAAMMVVFVLGLGVAYWAEAAGNPAFNRLGIQTDASALQAGGNMEGKEVRHGIVNSAIWATATTAASNGSVNSMHDSYTPLGGIVPLFNIMLGEVIIGGVGSGLYGMLLFAVLAVFVAGLMVGRTPEYLGKKIEAKEVKMTVLALILVLPISILGFTALAVVHAEGLKGPLNAGPHGFSEILYVYTSGTGNNGSAFAGISANTFFYNLTNGLSMLIGRYAFIVPMMAVAGSLVGKKVVPPSPGTFPTSGGTFVVLLVSVILVMGGLIFFPALSLGPIVEHLLMMTGKLF
ncbi:MAG TPA: potassium-transporting ATPase subunit KdpA [Candidatus Tectomicrobia bacterium]|nr:potassium-transporting ATPase subunit KdpA [Candidatus Tectomicrobia bacterium]